MDLTATLNDVSAFGVALRSVLGVLAAIAGLGLFAIAARMLYRNHRGEDGPNLAAVGISLFVGSALLQLALSIENTRTGLLAGAGTEVRSMMNAAVPVGSGGPFWQLLLSTCFVWIATIGAIGVFRGFLLWNKAGSGEGQQNGDYFWRGLWHILGGAICINIGS